MSQRLRHRKIQLQDSVPNHFLTCGIHDKRDHGRTQENLLIGLLSYKAENEEEMGEGTESQKFNQRGGRKEEN
jgi:hypothetical protein